jgi:hypothetical protein
LPHKYKKLRRASEADEDSEKCTICLSQFEIDNDVRLVIFVTKTKIYITNNLLKISFIYCNFLDGFHVCICSIVIVSINGLLPVNIVQYVALISKRNSNALICDKIRMRIKLSLILRFRMKALNFFKKQHLSVFVLSLNECLVLSSTNFNLYYKLKYL